ncbi:hypothetical protein O181_012786 [Austropuccinia psidii MF-1]|uniref:Major facilitator superfamily (MFS) profile domain-containing protein n=1 Tax=Austropuccinia psidii MF-1 TaxID=1389203 RepID=A0A9Q3BV77_9BASI|nr:hypothetical protein [Austropuccinia psidii MF-1]
MNNSFYNSGPQSIELKKINNRNNDELDYSNDKKQGFKSFFLNNLISNQTNSKDARNTDLNLAMEEINLPLPDQGFFAWRYLIVSFLIQGLVWGPPLSFGVFLNFAPYSQMNPSLAALIGTCCTGILYCFGSPVMSSMQRCPKLTLWYPTIGTLMCTGAFLSASYSTKVWQFVLSQGVMYAVGASLLYYPSLLFLAEWWIIRRGFAGGIMFAGSSTFGLIIPPILDWSLGKYGTSKTLRFFGIVFLAGMFPLLPFFRGRLPVSSVRRKNSLKTRIYFSRPLFWAFMSLSLIQSLAFFVPALYLPSYAISIGSPGGLVLALFAGASIVGQLAMGALSDHYDLGLIMGLNLMASTISTFVLWGFSKGFSMLATFAIVYGVSAGGFSCLWQRFAMTVAPSDPNPGSLVVYFGACRGIANLLTGPISGAMIQHSENSKGANGYKTLVYYSGSLMMIGTIGVALGKFFHQKQ